MAKIPQTCKTIDDQRTEDIVYTRCLSRKAVIRSTGITGLMVATEEEKGGRNSFGGNKNKSKN